MKIRIWTAVIALAVLSACGDDPFRIIWEGNPQESTIFSLDRPELNRASAFNLLERVPVVIEDMASGGRWDFVLDRVDGQLVFLPPRALNVQTEAGVVPVPNSDWDEVREAPADTALYNRADPVPVEVGTVYAVRTHRQPDRFRQQCVFFGKIQPLEVDHDEGRIRFLHDRNPECGNRRLVPRD